MKKLITVLTMLISVVSWNLFAHQPAMAAEGQGEADVYADCGKNPRCIHTQAWVKVPNTTETIHNLKTAKTRRLGALGYDGGGKECAGNDLYFLARIYYDTEEKQYMWDAAISMSAASSMLASRDSDYDPTYHGTVIDGHLGIAKSGATDMVKWAFRGRASFVPLATAKNAYSKAVVKGKYGWSRTSSLGWFCAPGTTTKTPVVTTENSSDTETSTYDGQTTLTYNKKNYTGKANKIELKDASSTTVKPNFSYCLKRASGTVADLKTQWNVPSDEKKTKTTWNDNKKDCASVKTETKTGTLNKNGTVTVCSSIGFYKTVTRTRTKTRTKTTTADGKVTYGDWVYGKWSTKRTGWQTKETCATFTKPTVVTTETGKDTETSTYDGQTTLTYSKKNYTGKTNKIELKNAKATNVKPKFSYCLKRTKGNVAALQTQWNVPSNEKGTKTTWKDNKKDCTDVKTETKTGKFNKNGTVTVCSSIGFYKTVTRTRTKTRKKTVAPNGKVTYGDWVYGKWSTKRTGWQTKETCATFAKPVVTTENGSDTETSTYDGQTTINYNNKNYTGENNKIEVEGIKPTIVESKLSYCLKRASGNVADLKTQYNVPSNEKGTKTTWNDNKKDCTNVKKPEIVSKTVNQGGNVQVCGTIGFYKTVTRTRTKTRTKTVAPNGKITYGNWTYGKWTNPSRTGWQTKKSCVTFTKPYLYQTVSYRYSGTVTGKMTLNGCDNVTSSEGITTRDCFIKSEGQDNGKTTVQFQDTIKRFSKNESGWSKNNSCKGDFKSSTGVDLSTEWQIEGINGAKGNSNGVDNNGNQADVIVGKYEKNTEDVTVPLGHISPSKYNKLTYFSKVDYVERSDGQYCLIGRSEQKTAQVTFNIYHPYNYNSSVSTAFSGDLYAGQTGTAMVTAEYIKRPNQLVAGDNDYMTKLPDGAGKYYAIFTVGENASSDTVKHLTGGTSILRNNSNKDDLCMAIGWNLTSCEHGSFSEKDKEIKFNVPDNYGVKVCVVAGLNYADSHGTVNPNDNKNTDAVPYDSNGNAREYGQGGLMINSDYWRISGVSCRVVKAKPRVQNWNAGFYTDGRVDMSVENKAPGQGFSLSNPNDKVAFGSWSETSFIQGKDSTGFASSSKLGGTGMSKYNFCESSPISIANVENGTPCSDTTSQLTSSSIRSATQETVEKTLARYVPNAGELNADGSGDLASVGGATPGKYEYHKEGAAISGRIVPLEKNSTQIIIVEGTAKITGNICVGTGTCGDNGALIVADRNNQPVSDRSNLASVIIIADNIEVAPGVTQIDATLMALGSNGVKNRKMNDDGKINTCSGLDPKNSETVQACMRTLYINGPVFAGSLVLNRTIYKTGGGANITPGQDLENMGSATAAEVFNLNPYVYMWAFEQADRYTQAELVYAQELAPRL